MLFSCSDLHVARGSPAPTDLRVRLSQFCVALPAADPAHRWPHVFELSPDGVQHTSLQHVEAACDTLLTAHRLSVSIGPPGLTTIVSVHTVRLMWVRRMLPVLGALTVVACDAVARINHKWLPRACVAGPRCVVEEGAVEILRSGYAFLPPSRSQQEFLGSPPAHFLSRFVFTAAISDIEATFPVQTDSAAYPGYSRA